MARINKAALTRLEIVQEATKQFLDKGFTATTISSIAKELEMSPGNLTFHYPTKEHLLAELVDMLCVFQWKQMEEEAGEGISSVLALCLELATMTSACETDAVFHDFFLSAYSSAMCLSIIRKNDAKRAKEVFGVYRPEWSDIHFTEAEILVSGIEYATLMTAGDPVPIETRIRAAIQSILSIYGVPAKVRDAKVAKVLAMDYKNLCKRVMTDFRRFVEKTNEETFRTILNQ